MAAISAVFFIPLLPNPVASAHTLTGEALINVTKLKLFPNSILCV